MPLSRDQLSKRLRRELGRFSEETSALEDRKIRVLDWQGPKTAERLLEEGQERFERKHRD